MGLGLVTVPYLINAIGVEKFGLLTIVWTLIGYFSIFDFGMGRALTQQIAVLKNNEQARLPSIIKSGLKMMSIAGLIGGGILALTVFVFGVGWLKVSTDLINETNAAVYLAALGIPFTTITSGLKGILEGFEDFYSSSLFKMILGISNFLFPIAIVYYIGPSLSLIVLSLVTARILIMLLHFIPLFRRISLKSLVYAEGANYVEKKETIQFGAWMTLSNFISPLMVNADRFVISSVLGASLVAYYTVPFDVIVRLLIIPAALTTTLFPRFSSLFISQGSELKELYKKSIKYILIGMGALAAGIIISSYLGLSIWISQEFAEKSWLLTCILGIGLLFNSLAQVPYALIQANREVKKTSIIHVAEFIIYVPMLYFTLKIWGIQGAAIAWTMRVLMDYVILSYNANKLLKNV